MADSNAALGKVLVIIPTYNEIENIDMITGRLRAAVPERRHPDRRRQLPDGTGRRADELAAADDHIKVLHRQGKEGLSAAYIAELRLGARPRLRRARRVRRRRQSHQPEQLPQILGGARRCRHGEGQPLGQGRLGRELAAVPRAAQPRRQPLHPTDAGHAGQGRHRRPQRLPRRTCCATSCDDVDRRGYGIQRDLTWNAHRRATASSRCRSSSSSAKRGDSKMGSDVVVEALHKHHQTGPEAPRRAGQGLFRPPQRGPGEGLRESPCSSCRSQERQG